MLQWALLAACLWCISGKNCWTKEVAQTKDVDFSSKAECWTKTRQDNKTHGGLSQADRDQGAMEVIIAASLGLTGEKEHLCAHVYRGLQLFVDRVNDQGVFKSSPTKSLFKVDGKTIRLKLVIYDDHSHNTYVEGIYEKMIEEDIAHLYLAPYSSGLSKVAANVTNRHNKIIMTHTAAVQSIYTNNGFKYVFSTSVMDEYYMKNGLKILQELGAKTFAAAWAKDNEFNNEVCKGAVKWAKSFNYTILGDFGFGEVDITKDIRNTSNLGPDVFVGCGYLVHAINTVVTSRALGFSPKAMMITQSTTNEFIQAVGAPNANYLMGPVSWSEKTVHGLECRVFGNATEFAAKFREMFNETEPTYHSAAAAAAALALMTAVSKVERDKISKQGWTLAEKMREELLKMDRKSFYGRLKFGAKGTLTDIEMLTEQILPLELTDTYKGQKVDRKLRYQESKIKLIHGEQKAFYPIRKWEQKELEVLPCDPGYVVDQTNITKVNCEPCAVGRYRPPSTLSCGDCGAGFYGDEEGLAECKVCPVDQQGNPTADCDWEGSALAKVSAGTPVAMPGYYKMPNRFIFKECEPAFLCLGNNTCYGKNRGVLCQQCHHGYTTQGNFHSGSADVCGKCPDGGSNFFLILCLFIAYGFYIGLIGYLTLASSSSVRAIHSIIMKKIVNHLQLATTAWAACEFKPSEFVDLSFLKTFVNLSQDPMKTIISLDCLLGDKKMPLHAARGVFGLIIVPSVLALNFFFFLTLLFIRLRAFMRQTARQSGMGNNRADDANKDDGDGDSSSSDDAMDELRHMVKWHGMQDTMLSCLQWSIVWLFILHPVVVKMLLDGVTCVELDVMRLKADLDVECKSAEHEKWFYPCTFGLFFYGLGIPFFTWVVLFRKRHRLMHLTVRKIYGFLYNGFESHWYYFEVVYMLRKVAILVCATIIPVMYVRIVTMLCLSFIFLALHIYCNPYDNRDYFVLDKMETTSLLALILTLQLRLFIKLRDEIEDSSPFVYVVVSHRIFDWTLQFLCIVCQLWFWALAIWSLLRNSVMKVLHLKADTTPERLTNFQQTVLFLEPNMHKVKINHNTYELDISALGQKERKFLFVALCDTMECYINTDQHFHPGYIVTAVRRAIALCVKDRHVRGNMLLHIIAENKNATGWLQTPKRWFAEITQAMNIGGKQKQPSHHLAEIMRRRRIMQIGKPKENSATVEELQNALMLCWPEIIEHRQRFFVLEKAPGEAAKEQGAAAKKRARKPDQGEDADESVAADAQPDAAEPAKPKLPTLSSEEMAEVFAGAMQPLEMSNVALRHRHKVLKQEVWLLRAEVEALQEHLSILESPDVAEEPEHHHEHLGKTEEPRGTEGGRAGSQEIHRDVHEQILDLAKQLQLLGRDSDAADVRTRTARLEKIQRMWLKAEAFNNSAVDVSELPPPPLSGVFTGDEAVEAAIISGWREGHGMKDLRQPAVKTVNELRELAARLRKDGCDVAGNLMEVIALKLGQGVLTEEEMHGRDMNHKKSRNDEMVSEVQDEELAKLHNRITEFVIHLHDLHQPGDAQIVDAMANRLLALRRCAPPVHELKHHEDPSLMPVTEDGTPQDVLDALDKMRNWQAMGPVARKAVSDTAEVATRLLAHGLAEEAEDLTALVDDLASGLVAHYGENPR